MKTLLTAALAVLAASASAGEVGMVSAIDVNKVCDLDGPKVDKDKVRDAYFTVTAEEQKRTGGFIVPAGEKAMYCHAAKIVALKAWGAEFAKKFDGKISYAETAKWEKFVKLYGQLYSDSHCVETGMPKTDEATMADYRGLYAKSVAGYAAGDVKSSSREDAIESLSAVDRLGFKGDCQGWLKDEKALLAAEIKKAADAKKKK